MRGSRHLFLGKFRFLWPYSAVLLDFRKLFGIFLELWKNSVDFLKLLEFLYKLLCFLRILCEEESVIRGFCINYLSKSCFSRSLLAFCSTDFGKFIHNVIHPN